MRENAPQRGRRAPHPHRIVLLDIDSRDMRNEAQNSSRDGNLMRRAWPKERHVSHDH